MQSDSNERAGATALRWFLMLAALALFDLFALSRAVRAVSRLAGAGAAQPNREALAIQALVWGSIKIACLGLFGWVLLMGGTRPASIPIESLLPGLGTLIAVPLAGGLWWSQRHA